MSTQTRFACPAAPDVCSGIARDFAHLRSIWPMRLHQTHPSVVNIARSAAFDLCKSHVDTRLCLSGEPPMQAIGVILTIVTGGTIIHRHMTTNALSAWTIPCASAATRLVPSYTERNCFLALSLCLQMLLSVVALPY